MLDRDHPIVIIAMPGRETEAAVRLGRIGFDHIAGYLKDGLSSLAPRPDLIATTARFSAPLAAERLSSVAAPVLLDIRSPREREQKHIVNSMSIPLNHLNEQLDKLPRDRALLVYCAGGYRSSIAASILQSRGYADVGEIAGGIAAWEAANLPVQK